MSGKRKTLWERAERYADLAWPNSGVAFRGLAIHDWLAGYRACQRDMRRKEGEK